MQLKADKIIGYALLLVGLIIIVFALESMWFVFTGARSPPSVFAMNSITLSVESPEPGQSPSQGIELLNGEQISKVVNMILWYVLMLFVASVGGRIGSLGVKLAREIKVEVKKEKLEEIKTAEVKGEE